VEFGDALDAFGTNLLRGRWRLGLFQVTSATPGATASNEIGARLALAPAGRWRLELDARYELEPVPDAGPGWTSQRAALVRDFHDWELGIGAWRDPLKDDWGVSVSIVPRGFAANLPTPADYD
jgi:hypothetical protein